MRIRRVTIGLVFGQRTNDLEVMFGGKSFKHVDIATTVFAKTEIMANSDTANIETGGQNIVDKIFRRTTRHSRVKREGKGEINTFISQ